MSVDPRFGHHFRLADLLAGYANRTCRNLRVCKMDALVSLDVWANLESRRGRNASGTA